MSQETKKLKVLFIGNSFSQDAHRFLAPLAAACGDELWAVNLYIGGCSLRSHYLNMLDDKAAYDFEFNGEKTGIKVSIRQALESDDRILLDSQSMKHISGVLKDLKEIQMIRSDADLREQEARIAKLQREAQEDQNKEPIRVIIDDGLNEYCK